MRSAHSTLVALSPTKFLEDLVRDIHSASERALKADPGERVDINRFETLSVQLEKAAEKVEDGSFAHRFDWPDSSNGAGPAFEFRGVEASYGESLSSRLPGEAARKATQWVDEGNIVVCLHADSADGQQAGITRSVPPAAQRWEAREGIRGTKAVAERFRSQLIELIDNPDRNSGQAIKPSGISNRVVTEILREFVVGTPDQMVKVPVEYRDGSRSANGFALRCLPLVEQPTGRSDIELRMALLSIRHPEMDPVVDGAWLRNAEVSKLRKSSETDDFVYATSVQQLRQLTDGGKTSVAIRMYQTGLETAVVGFYRAVVNHLVLYPGNLEIIPMFFSSRSTATDGTNFVEGLPWATMGGSR